MAWTPKEVEQADVPQCRYCVRCQSRKDESCFVSHKTICEDCVANTPLNKKKKELEKYAGAFLSSASGATNLDAFMEQMFSHLGSESGFAIMVADQLRQAFEKYPGRATNLTASIQIMKLMGIRDSNKLDREMKDFSNEELQLENKKLVYQIIKDNLTGAEQRSFAKQLLNSTGEVVVDALGHIEATETHEHR